MIIDLAKLQLFDIAFYQQIKPYTSGKLVVEDIPALPMAHAKLLTQLVQEHPELQPPSTEGFGTKPASPEERQLQELDEIPGLADKAQKQFDQDMKTARETPEQTRKENAEKSERVRKDKAEGLARLDDWVSQGLENTQANADIVRDWLNKNANGYLSAQNVDACILNVRASLTFRKPEPPKSAAPAPAVPPPAPPAVRLLSDGSQELPIDTVPSSRYTVAQLRDLDARQREARRKAQAGMPRGSFGTNFFEPTSKL